MAQCAGTTTKGDRCRKRAVTGTERCAVHSGDHRRRCTARSSQTGERCQMMARKGQTVCQTHGGNSPQALAKANRRLALDEARGMVEAYGQELDVSPEEAIFAMIRVTAGNVMLLQDLVSELDAGVGPGGIAGRTGNERIVHEAKPHVLVVMYNEERDRLVRFSKVAAEIGLSERMVTLAESQGQLIAKIFTAALDDPEWGLSKTAREAGKKTIARHLRAV